MLSNVLVEKFMRSSTFWDVNAAQIGSQLLTFRHNLSVPKRRQLPLRSVTLQKSEDLIYTAAEDCYHDQ
jgi:hypothetical protein